MGRLRQNRFVCSGNIKKTGADSLLQHNLDPSLQRQASEHMSPTPSGRPLSSGPGTDVVMQNPSLDDNRFSVSNGPPPPPPKLASDVIQFVFMRSRTKLLRFDWPNDGPLHSHMTFEKLLGVIDEHVNSVRASFPDTSSVDQLAGTDIPESPAEVAKRKARATLMAVEDDSSQSGINAQQAGDEAASSDETPGELLRRELQQAAGAAIRSPFDGLKVTVRALTASGMTKVETDAEWEDVKHQIADTVWLEGLLRVVVDVL